MSTAWASKATRRDRDVPLVEAMPQPQIDHAKAQVIALMAPGAHVRGRAISRTDRRARRGAGSRVPGANIVRRRALGALRRRYLDLYNRSGLPVVSRLLLDPSASMDHPGHCVDFVDSGRGGLVVALRCIDESQPVPVLGGLGRTPRG